MTARFGVEVSKGVSTRLIRHGDKAAKKAWGMKNAASRSRTGGGDVSTYSVTAKRPASGFRNARTETREGLAHGPGFTRRPITEKRTVEGGGLTREGKSTLAVVAAAGGTGAAAGMTQRRRKEVAKNAFGVEVSKVGRRAKRENLSAVAGAGYATGAAGFVQQRRAGKEALKHVGTSARLRALGNVGGADQALAAARTASKRGIKGVGVAVGGIAAGEYAMRRRERIPK